VNPASVRERPEPLSEHPDASSEPREAIREYPGAVGVNPGSSSEHPEPLSEHPECFRVTKAGRRLCGQCALFATWARFSSENPGATLNDSACILKVEASGASDGTAVVQVEPFCASDETSVV